MVDSAAHAVISWLIFRKRSLKYLLLAIFFGIMPDLLSMAVFSFLILSSGKVDFEQIPPLTGFAEFFYSFYGNITHSLIISFSVILIGFFIRREWLLFLFAWPLHIIIDIPTHSLELFPTPFLWPVSDWYFPGVKWLTGWVLLAYWTIILVWLGVILIKEKVFSSGKEFINPINE